MSYQQYMNMGFGAPGAGHPYMMGFPGGVPMQMQQAQAQQYLANHRQPAPAAAHQAAAPNKAAGGKRKMNNDPNRPKRPTSAYFYFVQIEREEAAKRGEKITRVTEWTKLVSAKWRELTVTEKEQFQVMAATDKARYTQQMAIYTGKDANRPKRPQSAYFLWLADFRATMKDKFVENKDILRAAGEEWRKMTTAQKVPYEQRAEEERRKYEVKMKDYNMAGGAKKARMDATTAAAATTSAAEQRPAPVAAATAAPTTPSQVQYQLSQQQQQQQQLQQHHQQLQQQQQLALLQQQITQHQQTMQQQQQQQQQQAARPNQNNEDDDDDDDDDDDEDGDFDDEDGKYE